jgi:hypothetical protein
MHRTARGEIAATARRNFLDVRGELVPFCACATVSPPIIPPICSRRW